MIDLGKAQLDPYRTFKFRVKWDGKDVAGFSKMSTLAHATAHEPISLERGVTYDAAFAQWAANVGDAPGAKVSSKDLVIEVYDAAGQLALAYKVFRCRVSEYQALPDIDAGSNAVKLELIKLENEGWERDIPVTEPGEPTSVRKIP